MSIHACMVYLQAKRENYTIIAVASVTIVDEFQSVNDDIVDNSDSVCLVVGIVLSVMQVIL